MKFTLVCLFAISAFVYVYGQEYYSDKFDNIDVDQILNNDRLLKRYIDCMLDKPNVRCPSEALDIKQLISEGLETNCAKCTNRQKELLHKAIRFIIINKRNMWNELVAKFDPERKHAQEFEDEALKKSI